ncbi:uncharacterized protein LOC100678845 isoform X2 [Nasonia vitripennis]|uniref:C2H2-type domain-containing protein n=1 Tax=Nasonia vitripennis TaxID=7425 RepID=A0A7M7IR17_NASVI|nr:uncharacterized protein LOC100678845 isoform X2 [Nasonia vitripennis]
MEQILIKKEPYWHQEIEEVVNIYNHSPIDDKPNNIKLEYIDNNISSTPIYFGNYFETKQELNWSYEGHEIHKVKSNDSEKNVHIDNLSLIDEKINNIKLEKIDQHISSTPFSFEGYSETKQELNCSQEDHSIQNVNNTGSDDLLSKLKKATIVLERLSIVQILKLTKKSTDLDCTYRLNVDAINYACTYYCSKCDKTVDTKSTRNIINRPNCECIPTLAYQCMRCDKHLLTYRGMQRHINTKGLCKSRKRFLYLEGFNDDEWEKLNCPKCNVSLENIVQFTKHVNDCAEVPKFWCSFCDYGVKLNHTFQFHLKLHAPKLNSQPETGISAEELMQKKECNRTKKKCKPY